MMAKPNKEKPGKISRVKGWTANFLSNVLGVIVGIVLTFGVNALIQQHSEKRAIHTMMTLIREEIVYNKNEFVAMRENFLETKEACRILLSSRWKAMPQDSVWRHVENVVNIRSYKMRYTAWNVFQKSDIFTTVDDKELLVALSELYADMEMGQEFWDIYQRARTPASDMFAYDYFTANPSLSATIGAMLENKDARQFLNHAYTFEHMYAAIINRADYMLYLINKSGNYQSELRDMDEDFETFRKNN